MEVTKIVEANLLNLRAGGKANQVLSIGQSARPE